VTERGQLPQVLLMENVPQVHGTKNKEHFIKWIQSLENIGYSNFYQDLNAKDYGVPQTRNRCFMVSVLGNYHYEFPHTKELKLRLKDMLEAEVDEKYYLSERMANYILSENDKWTGNNNKSIMNRDIACAKTTRESQTRADASDYICDQLPENFNLKEFTKPKVLGGIGEKKSNGGRQFYQQDRIYDDNISISVTTAFNPYYAIKSKNYRLLNLVDKTKFSDKTMALDCYNQIAREDYIQTIKTNVDKSNMNMVYNDLRIRKLTPKECFRLMGVKDEDFEKIAKNQSNASLYHLAGDSIVVDVLMAIFKEMLC
jgi:DNA (cytosine-5)-methyltransferase 1